jgi:hypothetical protein
MDALCREYHLANGKNVLLNLGVVILSFVEFRENHP